MTVDNRSAEQSDGGPCENTDRHLWPETSKYGAPEESIHVTKEGFIGINCGGYVYVKPLSEWHKLAGGKEAMQPKPDFQSSKTQLPPRPNQPQPILGLCATDAERVRHYDMMLDYWIAEAKWQAKRADLAERAAHETDARADCGPACYAVGCTHGPAVETKRPHVGTASMYAQAHNLAVTTEWMRGWNACLDAIDAAEDSERPPTDSGTRPLDPGTEGRGSGGRSEKTSDNCEHGIPRRFCTALHDDVKACQHDLLLPDCTIEVSIDLVNQWNEGRCTVCGGGWAIPSSEEVAVCGAWTGKEARCVLASGHKGEHEDMPSDPRDAKHG